MINHKTTYACAKVLMQQHSGIAEDIALRNMLSLVDRGDLKAASVWLGIMSAINDLELSKSQPRLM